MLIGQYRHSVPKSCLTRPELRKISSRSRIRSREEFLRRRKSQMNRCRAVSSENRFPPWTVVCLRNLAFRCAILDPVELTWSFALQSNAKQHKSCQFLHRKPVEPTYLGLCHKIAWLIAGTAALQNKMATLLEETFFLTLSFICQLHDKATRA